MPLSRLLLAGRFPELVSFFAVGYLAIFLPLALLAVGLAPQRLRRYALLLVSYAFYWLVSGQLLAYLLLSTLSAHYFGLWLDRLQAQRDAALAAVPRPERKALRRRWQRRSQGVVALAAALHVGVLFALKYSGFFLGNVNALLRAAGLSLQLAIPAYLQPIGISFFTLQALSYILDVHQGSQKADDCLPRLALFMAFFPQIVEGPICRYRDTAEPLWNVQPLRAQNLKLGAERVLYGAMKKIVVADRLNQFVGAVFSKPESYGGGLLAAGAVCYTVQLYMDFSGSMDAVCGMAQMLGIAMPENFARPFFARTISEFWTRWHVTLGTWFKSYVFYPVSTSAPMKALTLSARKRLGNHYGPLAAGAVALFCVWLCNGLWHGAGWHYVAFGMYHFALILGGSLIAPAVRWANGRLGVNAEGRPYRLAQLLRTWVLVVVGELIFRAEDMGKCLEMLRGIFTRFGFSAADKAARMALSLDGKDAAVVLAALAIVFAVSLANERGRSVRDWLERRHVAVRWALLYAMILFIITFGAYGYGYEAVIPLYANY